MSQEELDHLFNAIFLRSAGLWCLRFRPFCNTEFFRPVYEKKVYVQECKYQGFAREGGQDTLQKRSNDPECPFFQFLPKEKNTRYNLRNTSVSVPRIYTDRFKNVFSNRIIFRYDM